MAKVYKGLLAGIEATAIHIPRSRCLIVAAKIARTDFSMGWSSGNSMAENIVSLCDAIIFTFSKNSNIRFPVVFSNNNISSTNLSSSISLSFSLRVELIRNKQKHHKNYAKGFKGAGSRNKNQTRKFYNLISEGMCPLFFGQNLVGVGASTINVLLEIYRHLCTCTTSGCSKCFSAKFNSPSSN